jgi:hypothetical protein
MWWRIGHDAHADPGANPYTHSHPCSHSDADTCSDADSHPYANPYADANPYANPNPNPYANPYANADAYTYSHTNSDEYVIVESCGGSAVRSRVGGDEFWPEVQWQGPERHQQHRRILGGQFSDL